MRNPLYIHKLEELKIDPKYWADHWTDMDETIDFGQIAFMRGTWKWMNYKLKLNGWLVKLERKSHALS